MITISITFYAMGFQYAYNRYDTSLLVLASSGVMLTLDQAIPTSTLNFP